MSAKFGSSGIRGPFGELATPELALALGRAVGTMRKRVIVGRDARATGQLLENALVAGLVASGARVTRAGILPTPALAYAARDHDAGIVVTASHNPAPDNGFKLWEPNGRAFDAVERAEVERLLADAPPYSPWNDVGSETLDTRAIDAHIDRVLELVGPLPRRLRVVVDCGNGAASWEAPLLLRRLGCDVVTLNAQPDGHFPGRPSEPNEKNLTHLKQAVVATGADLGIAHDGDADRCMAVTESGRFVQGDELLVLFARRYAGSRIVCPVDVSRIVDDASGCEVVRTKVGDAYVSERIQEVDAAWGGEASGAWIFPEMSQCPDGPMAAAVLCHLVAKEGGLDKQLESLPRYPLWRDAWRFAPARMDAVMAAVQDAFSDGRQTTLDGLRVDYDEGWVLVRPSGTEPKIRATVEAVRPASLDKLKTRVVALMKNLEKSV